MLLFFAFSSVPFTAEVTPRIDHEKCGIYVSCSGCPGFAADLTPALVLKPALCSGMRNLHPANMSWWLLPKGHKGTVELQDFFSILKQLQAANPTCIYTLNIASLYPTASYYAYVNPKAQDVGTHEMQGVVNIKLETAKVEIEIEKSGAKEKVLKSIPHLTRDKSQPLNEEDVLVISPQLQCTAGKSGEQKLPPPEPSSIFHTLGQWLGLL